MSSSMRLKQASSVAVLLSAAASASATPTLIAITGGAAPGGGTYLNFTNPVLNASGEVAFAGNISGGTSSSGIFTGTSSLVQAIALQGALAPGTSGGSYGTLFASSTTTSTTLNSSGELAFQAPLTGGTSTSGIFAGTTALTLQAIALQATAAPAGGNYSAFLANGVNTAYSPLINDAGQVALQSSLSGGTAASGIFVGTSAASLSTVALVGGAAPTPPGGTYATVVTVPTLNPSGQVAFVSLVSGLQGIFAGAPGSAATVMYQGTAAPGAGGELYGTPTTTYSYNNAGQVGFISSLTGGSLGQPTTGVFAGAPGSVQNVALGASSGGSLAPGGSGGSFTTLSSVTINGNGQVAFTAGLTGGSSTSGLFFGAPGSLQAVALVGGTSPDGATYSSFGSTELPNDSDEVAFLANLSGTGVTAGVNGEELVAGTPGNLQELVREGDVVDGLTVNGFGLLTGSGGQDGKGIDFNDSGEIAYRLTFTNGSSGIFESTIAVPEPTSIGMLAVGTAGVLLRRRRKTAHKLPLI